MQDITTHSSFPYALLGIRVFGIELRGEGDPSAQENRSKLDKFSSLAHITLRFLFQTCSNQHPTSGQYAVTSASVYRLIHEIVTNCGRSGHARTGGYEVRSIEVGSLFFVDVFVAGEGRM